jgi:hypothetical protein
MSQEIRGLENNIQVRMIYLDTKEEIAFKSIAQANRKTNINAQTIRESLNPILKRRFIHNARVVVFRIKK